MKLLDFGYQGKSLSDLANFLKKHKVDVLVDVRENSVRVRKFKKNSLEALCRSLNVEYVWARELGNPFRHESSWQEAYEAYLNHSEAARKRIEELKRLLLDGKTLCLLCYEQNPNACHRTLVKKLLLRLDPFPF